MAQARHLFDHDDVFDAMDTIDCDESEDGGNDDSDVDNDFVPPVAGNQLEVCRFSLNYQTPVSKNF